MTWIKICGITNLEDALVAVDAGADALGFVFYEKSPRKVAPRTVAEICRRVPDTIERVGVFVESSPAHVTEKKRIVQEAGLTAIQVHQFQPTPSVKSLDELVAVGVKVFVAWPADFVSHGQMGGFRWRSKAKGKVSAIFLDSGTRKIPGGTGRTFDWKKAAPVLTALNGDFNFVIAGGLLPDNVAESLQLMHPYGVDVSSGVEARPGKKDPEKVRAFVQAVRAADRKVG
jgi:phosphoribosylanthranilate isomerase